MLEFSSKYQNTQNKEEFVKELKQYNIDANCLTNCIVLKGLYKPDKVFKYLEPIYWKERNIEIRRCIKFYDNLKPVITDKEEKNSIEVSESSRSEIMHPEKAHPG